MIRDICVDVKRRVDTALTWTSDKETVDRIEHWQSHAHRILNQSSYRSHDDCDGFALTSAELCVHFGINPRDVRIVMCEVPNEGGHLVCAVDDPQNQETWVLDNIERSVVPWSRLNYRWIKYMSYDNLGNWFNF